MRTSHLYISLSSMRPAENPSTGFLCNSKQKKFINTENPYVSRLTGQVVGFKTKKKLNAGANSRNKPSSCNRSVSSKRVFYAERKPDGVRDNWGTWSDDKGDTRTVRTKTGARTLVRIVPDGLARKIWRSYLQMRILTSQLFFQQKCRL